MYRMYRMPAAGFFFGCPSDGAPFTDRLCAPVCHVVAWAHVDVLESRDAGFVPCRQGQIHLERPSALPASAGVRLHAPHDRHRCGLFQDQSAHAYDESLVCFVLRVTLTMLLAAVGDIPNVEVRLNSTYSIYARDPTLNNKEMTQQGASGLHGGGTLEY